jgi:hypothetical protein
LAECIHKHHKPPITGSSGVEKWTDWKVQLEVTIRDLGAAHRQFLFLSVLVDKQEYYRQTHCSDIIGNRT